MIRQLKNKSEPSSTEEVVCSLAGWSRRWAKGDIGDGGTTGWGLEPGKNSVGFVIHWTAGKAWGHSQCPECLRGLEWAVSRPHWALRAACRRGLFPFSPGLVRSFLFPSASI